MSFSLKDKGKLHKLLPIRYHRIVSAYINLELYLHIRTTCSDDKVLIHFFV